mgnify:CR=1 FL=1
MSQSHPGSTNIAVSDADLPHLDRLVGAALQAGYRPMGKRPSRATIVADMIRRATAALHGPQGGPQQPPSGPQDATPACAAPAQQDTPQSPAEALAQALPDVPALPVAPAPRPRSYAPHYFAVHGSAAGAGA